MTGFKCVLGARPSDNGAWMFRVWAPHVETIELCIGEHAQHVIAMKELERGYHEVCVPNVSPHTRYRYRLNGELLRPDPASRYQPEGVHGPSALIHPEFDWDDSEWRGVLLENAVIYELHVGTFTPGGTFDSIIEHLDRLRELGITLLELMPIAQYPGTRNWGYDGVQLFAVHHTYGGPVGLKRLVRECHRRGIGVIVDVVYNHLGPEGNYLNDFGPYFTDKYRTPWGRAVNVDDRWCDEVRRYFIENALMWIEEYHIDGLRLDAIHAICDQSAYPFVQELSDVVHEAAQKLQRSVLVIAESDLNDPKVVRDVATGGWGLDAAWSDDLHHAIHACITGERKGYYEDFGGLQHIATALRNGYVYAGNWSKHRGRRHGASARDTPSNRLVCSLQNHDQVGNRMCGERLSSLASFEQLKLAAATILLSSYTPMLFMGEEFAATTPFLYFISHSAPELIEAVRRGRAEEFAEFHWKGDPPDPHTESTFQRSKIDWSQLETATGQALHALYQHLLKLRSAHPIITSTDRHNDEIVCHEDAGFLTIYCGVQHEEEFFMLLNYASVDRSAQVPRGHVGWCKVLDTADHTWAGPGSVAPRMEQGALLLHAAPYSAVAYVRQHAPIIG